MKTPTITNAGPVERVGIDESKGVRKMQMKFRNAMVSAVRPVRPPSYTPAIDSPYVVTELVPKKPPTKVPTASAMKAAKQPGKVSGFEGSTSPLRSAAAYRKPMVPMKSM